jgi:hypothetical protein
MPGFLLYRSSVYFLQTPKEVVLIWAEDHQVRHIYLNSRIRPTPRPLGSANPSAATKATRWSSTRRTERPHLCRQLPHAHTDKLHVVERFI